MNHSVRFFDIQKTQVDYSASTITLFHLRPFRLSEYPDEPKESK
jgi:hypothetical protein